MVLNKRSEKAYKLGVHTIFIILCVTCIIPIWTVVAISLESGSSIAKIGYPFLIPRDFDLSSYRSILKSPTTILNAYKSTFYIALVGVPLYVIIATLCAYPLSRSDFRFRRVIVIYFLITMLFSGGTIPFYLLMTRTLGLRNSYWSMILPYLCDVWSIILLRTYMRSLPQDIFDAALIDGAGQTTIYLRFVLPLSKACIAVIAFSKFMAYWGTYSYAMYFITDPAKYPLQFLLQNMLNNLETIKKAMEMGLAVYEKIPGEPMRMAMVVLTIGPSILVFPLFQKYFQKGMILGSMKG